MTFGLKSPRLSIIFWENSVQLFLEDDEKKRPHLGRILLWFCFGEGKHFGWQGVICAGSFKQQSLSLDPVWWWSCVGFGFALQASTLDCPGLRSSKWCCDWWTETRKSESLLILGSLARNQLDHCSLPTENIECFCFYFWKGKCKMI